MRAPTKINLPRSQPTSLSPAHQRAIYGLWDNLAQFPASQTDEALTFLMEWFHEHLDVDNVIWLGSLLMQDEAHAKNDPLLGWRLRARHTLLPDTEHYRKLVASYLAKEHYGNLIPSFYSNRPRPDTDIHVGSTSRAIVAGAGTFRVHRLRDGWINFAELRRTQHYQLYYTELGITDRIWAVFPVTPTSESMFLFDRHRRIKPRRHFTARDVKLVEAALRGIPKFHRHLMLYNGVLRGTKPLSPLKSRILQGLLTTASEKEIADSIGQKPLTMRKYVTELYGEFGVKTRQALMSLWLGES